MVFGLAHFIFCHTGSLQKPAGPHFTHNRLLASSTLTICRASLLRFLWWFRVDWQSYLCYTVEHAARCHSGQYVLVTAPWSRQQLLAISCTVQ